MEARFPKNGWPEKESKQEAIVLFWTYFEPTQMFLIHHFLYLTTEVLTVIPITIANNPVELNKIGELLCYTIFISPQRNVETRKIYRFY